MPRMVVAKRKTTKTSMNQAIKEPEEALIKARDTQTTVATIKDRTMIKSLMEITREAEVGITEDVELIEAEEAIIISMMRGLRRMKCRKLPKKL